MVSGFTRLEKSGEGREIGDIAGIVAKEAGEFFADGRDEKLAVSVNEIPATASEMGGSLTSLTFGKRDVNSESNEKEPKSGRG